MMWRSLFSSLGPSRQHRCLKILHPIWGGMVAPVLPGKLTLNRHPSTPLEPASCKGFDRADLADLADLACMHLAEERVTPATREVPREISGQLSPLQSSELLSCFFGSLSRFFRFFGSQTYEAKPNVREKRLLTLHYGTLGTNKWHSTNR